MMVRACGPSQWVNSRALAAAKIIRDTPGPNGTASSTCSLEESLSGFTAAPAWVSGRQERSGSIRVGKWADLTVFAQDLFGVPASEWPFVPVEMTIVNGEVVYRYG
jgi:predicted amidohydrolase YtcJ